MDLDLTVVLLLYIAIVVTYSSFKLAYIMVMVKGIRDANYTRPRRP